MSNLHKLYPKVAIVADQMVAFGGADREMFSVLKLFPEADIYTILFDKSKYPNLKNTVKSSSLQKLTKFLPKGFYRHIKIFTPFVYESFDFSGYDLVLSISAGPAKAVITDLYQTHVALVMTPPRSLWDKELNVRGSRFKKIYSSFSRIINTYMRVWDYSVSKRIKYWVANSKYIQKKIERIYGQSSTVIYPGIEKKWYEDIPKILEKKVSLKYDLPKKYYLVLSRLYDYKRVDTAIRACIQTGDTLLISGDGPDMGYLQNISKGSDNIRFLGYLKDEDNMVLYRRAEALLFCGLEDFGLIPVEAMAGGTPVLAYDDGGLKETVVGGVTGEFFRTEEELIKLLMHFKKNRYNKEDIIKNAGRFSEEKFLDNLEKYIKKVYGEARSKRRL